MERQERPDSVWVAFLRWQSAHPDLARLYPANQIAVGLADHLRWLKERRVLRSIQPVIAGTYRMSLSLDGEPERQFYLRTWPLADNEWRPNPAPQVQRDPLEEPPRPEAYNMMASGAASLETLPRECAVARAMSRQGYVYVIDPPHVAGDSHREWRGMLEVNLMARQFPGDSVLARFNRQAFDEWAGRWRTAAELETPARFWLDTDRVLHVEQTTQLQDGRRLVVRGERMGPDVIACDR